jgi:long-chain acyl-CoA synthetase
MIISRIQEAAREFSEKNAIIFNDHSITYAQFDNITNRLANGLKNAGIQAGDRVALLMPNLPHFIFSYYAILKVGGIVVPINYMMEDNEFNGVLGNIKPQAIIYWEGFRKYIQDYLNTLDDKPYVIVLGNQKSIDHANLPELISKSASEIEPFQPEAGATAILQFTSGVTEPPKGIEFSYENLLSSIDGAIKFFRFNEADVFGALLPLFFIFSQNVLLNSAFSRGSTVILFSKVDYSRIAQSIDRHRISVLAGSPGFYKSLAELDPKLFSGSSLKFNLSSWQPVSENLESRFEQRFGMPLLNCYSITETGGIVAANHPSFERRSGSVGLRLPEVEIQIHDGQGLLPDHDTVGEIIIQGKMVMKSYWNGPELTASRLKDGWYHTGDMGKIDEQGNIYLINKKAEIIVKSGFPIYTSEIEQILVRHPKVKEAVVMAVPHPDHKEDVQACIALKENETATAEEIIQYCRSQVPVYKCPQIVKFYSSLPRTKMGRIFKRKLQENSVAKT